MTSPDRIIPWDNLGRTSNGNRRALPIDGEFQSGSQIRGPLKAGSTGSARRRDWDRESERLHRHRSSAYSASPEWQEMQMANKEQKRSSREAKKPKQKKKGADKPIGK